MNDYLIYGANGYTGALAAREAAARGHRPVLAGRNALEVADLARKLGLEHRAFALDEPAEVDAGIKGVRVVLHCAGPFAHTSKPMADACLRSGVHYLDVTGEASVFLALAARDAPAKAAGVMLLPGVGFDVVPSDCLAAHLKRRLPTATRLALGLLAEGGISRGTATTMVENLPKGGLVRRGGVLTEVPAGWRTRAIDFGPGPGVRKAITIPWGDVVTAYHSTGIPDIEVYLAASFGQRVAHRLVGHFGWLIGLNVMQSHLKQRIRFRPPGPTDEQRARGRTHLWGEAADDAGRRVVSRLRGPEGYTFTALTALAVVERVRAGQSPAGFQTPSSAYGPDFVLEVKGVEREDELAAG